MGYDGFVFGGMRGPGRGAGRRYAYSDAERRRYADSLVSDAKRLREAAMVMQRNLAELRDRAQGLAGLMRTQAGQQAASELADAINDCVRDASALPVCAYHIAEPGSVNAYEWALGS